ncbi:hypothetical protein ABZ570_07610 [Micromonospora sp. NPDC007271]|uniref:hypothetical protein n=1 Tax=Micromonospora sp. NPDC007271 TaxID=3154587 RepID=UPI0033F96510
MSLIVDRHVRSAPDARRTFLDNDWQLVVIDDFLHPDRAAEIAADAARRTDYFVEYGLMPNDEEGWAETRGRHVDHREYEAAPRAQRYYRFSTTRTWSYRDGQRRLDETCPFTVDEMKALLDFVRSATGYSLGKIRCMIRRFDRGDFIGAHHQNRLERVLTAHLPLTSGDDGLVLELYGHDGRTLPVPLTFNSFSFFDLRARWREAVPERTSDTPVHMIHFWCYA